MCLIIIIIVIIIIILDHVLTRCRQHKITQPVWSNCVGERQNTVMITYRALAVPRVPRVVLLLLPSSRPVSTQRQPASHPPCSWDLRLHPLHLISRPMLASASESAQTTLIIVHMCNVTRVRMIHKFSPWLLHDDGLMVVILGNFSVNPTSILITTVNEICVSQSFSKNKVNWNHQK